MPRTALTPEVLVLVSERFKALGEPARLCLLNALRGGERTVSDLVNETALGQANTSKHLQVLYAAGLVSRRREGPHVWYAIADDRIWRLCDIMCDQLQATSRSWQAVSHVVAGQ